MIIAIAQTTQQTAEYHWERLTLTKLFANDIPAMEIIKWAQKNVDIDTLMIRYEEEPI